mmetsp:Transcript_1736/g.3846  ORF Transcript_1736/g.3846 Transcript_1736/m.3846 type:complete len:211 (+) Transcript_1736:2534-3166(+)
MPSRCKRKQVTVHEACIFCKALIIPSASSSVHHWSVAEPMITAESTIGVTMSSPSMARANTSSHATHIQSMILKMPPNVCFNNKTQGLSLSGGVNRFSPKISIWRWALPSSRPNLDWLVGWKERPSKAVPSASCSSPRERECEFWEVFLQAARASSFADSMASWTAAGMALRSFFLSLKLCLLHAKVAATPIADNMQRRGPCSSVASFNR